MIILLLRLSSHKLGVTNFSSPELETWDVVCPASKKSNFPTLDYAFISSEWGRLFSVRSLVCRSHQSLPGHASFKPWKNRAATPRVGLLCWADETLSGPGQPHFLRKLSSSDILGSYSMRNFPSPLETCGGNQWVGRSWVVHR